MCWRTYSKDCCIPMITNEDMRVCKVVRDWHADSENFNTPEYRPWYYPNIMEYKEGEVYESTFDIVTYKGMSIYDGLHSWKECCHIVSVRGEELTRIVTGKFLRMFIWRFEEKYAALMFCTIPKGSTVYCNEYDEVVSNVLRVDKIVPLKHARTFIDMRVSLPLEELRKIFTEDVA